MTRATTFRATAVTGALLLALLMIMTVSRAAFSDPTSNDGNLVGAGSVVLYNNAPNGGLNTNPGDETGDPMFGATAGTWTIKADNLAPGNSVQHCIVTTYAGSLGATVALDSVSIGTATVTNFEDEVNLTVARYTTTDCTGTAAAVASGTLGSPSIGETAWAATGGAPLDTRSYLVTLELDSGADNSFQGASLGDIDFEWVANQA